MYIKAPQAPYWSSLMYNCTYYILHMTISLRKYYRTIDTLMRRNFFPQTICHIHKCHLTRAYYVRFWFYFCEFSFNKFLLYYRLNVFICILIVLSDSRRDYTKMWKEKHTSKRLDIARIPKPTDLRAVKLIRWHEAWYTRRIRCQ